MDGRSNDRFVVGHYYYRNDFGVDDDDDASRVTESPLQVDTLDRRLRQKR